jgi:hypothetical protein
MGLHGPYAMVFSRSGLPSSSLDTSFFSSLSISGYVGSSGRGTVSGTASGVSSSYQRVVHWLVPLLLTLKPDSESLQVQQCRSVLDLRLLQRFLHFSAHEGRHIHYGNMASIYYCPVLINNRNFTVMNLKSLVKASALEQAALLHPTLLPKNNPSAHYGLSENLMDSPKVLCHIIFG